MNYNLYAGPTFERVRQVLREMGEPEPHPSLSVGWLAEENDQVNGVIVVQSIPFVEPCVGNSAEVIKGLFNCAEQFILESKAPRVLMHTSHRGMQAMLLRKKAKRISDPVFDWRRL